MDRFEVDLKEDDLKQALQSQEPSEGFANRVMARVNGAPSRRKRLMPRLAWAMAAAAMAMTVGGGALYERRRRGEQARDQLMLALRITGQKLDHVRKQINVQERKQ